MNSVAWIRQRFVALEPLGDPEAGVVKARDRLAPPDEPFAVVKRARHPLARQALTTELAELSRLNHPSLRRVLARGIDSGEDLAVFEFVHGVDLATHLSQRPGEVRACAVGILRVLVHLHGRDRVHGDLKPDNILVSEGEVKLIDMGLVVPLGAQPRGGTQGYLPPEYQRGAPASVAGDLYALGATLRALEPELDPELERLVSACTATAPADRPASADSALAILGAMPRPVDRSGQPERIGGRQALAAVGGALERLDGTTVVVEAPPGSGRTRLIRDALRQTFSRSQPVADSTLGRGHDPFGGLARVLLPQRPDDPDRSRALGLAAASRRGLAVVLDDADGASPQVRPFLPLAVATLSELGRGALILVGADAEMAETLASAGASRARLGRLGLVDAEGLLRAAGAVADREVARALLQGSRGRAGLCARLALDLADRPAVTPAEVERRAAEARLPGHPPVTPSPPEPDRALALARSALDQGASGAAVELIEAAFPDLIPREHPEAAALLARALAHQGRLTEAADLALELDQPPDPPLWLAAARWLERLGRYGEARDLVRGLAGHEDPEIRGAAAATLALVTFGLGDPAEADRVAAEALELADLAPGLACRLRCVRSDAALTRGDPNLAIEHAAAAQTAAQRQGDPTLLPQAVAREAAGFALGGDPVRARERYQAALDAALGAGDVVGLAPYLLNLATAEHRLGELGSAIERYQHAARLAGRLGRQVARAAALVNWAGLLVDIDATDEAGPVLDDARAAARAAGSALYSAQAELVRASLVGRGSPRQGCELARAAREAFRDCGAARQALEAALLEAELSLDLDRPEPALTLIAEQRGELRRGGLAARAALLEARARLLNHDVDLALRRAERAAELARGDHDHELEARALSVAAQVHGRLGTGAEGALALRAREALGQVASRLPAGLRDRFLRAPARLAVMRAAPAEAGGARPGPVGPAPGRILGLVRRLLLEGSERRLLETTVDEAVDLVGAERAFLLRRRASGEPYVAVARNIGRETIVGQGPAARFSRSVAERVLASGERVITTSAADDPALQGARSVLDLGLRSILCVPIRSPAGVVGALYLDHRYETDRFGPRTSELVQGLADIIGVALENARLRREAEDKARELERANAALSQENERRAAEVERLAQLLERGGARAGEAPGGMVGGSAPLRRAIEVARRVAPSNLPVLIEGESGTGKELLARFVHDTSLRADGPFMAINCGAVPENLLESELFGHVRGAFTGAARDHPGLFRAAEGGTVLLDEIGEMSPRMQPRLLRVLQESEVWPLGLDAPVPIDVRVLAATNRDLEAEVAAGRFRQDLFYRLIGVKVVLPPLRDRREDIPPLTEAFLERIASEPGMRPLGLSREALRVLLRSDWPGNVRELEQTLRRAVLLAEGDEITAADLEITATAPTRREALRGFDRNLVETALKATGGNRTAAAKSLGVSRATLHRWIKRYGIG